MIEYPDIVQLSPAWWDVRRGVPTASEFDRIVMPSTGRRSKSVAGYIGELMWATTPAYKPEGMTEKPMNPAMRHGVECEPEAREFYEHHTGRAVRLCGFCTTDDGRFGMSPDGLVFGERGALELKCPQPETHKAYLLKGKLPTQYRCQVHGQLVVGEGALDYVDFLSYCRGHDPLLVRVEPDEFTATLKAALEEFWGEYTAALGALYGRAVRSAADVKRLTRRAA